MEIVEVVAKQNFYDSRTGDVMNKQRLKMPRHIAQQLSSINLVTILGKLKAAPQVPVLLKPPQNGQGVSPVLYVADQALPKQTAVPRKRGRPKKVGAS